MHGSVLVPVWINVWIAWVQPCHATICETGETKGRVDSLFGIPTTGSEAHMAAHGLQLRHVGEDFLSLLEKSSLALDAVARKMDAEFASRYEKAGVRDSCEFEFRPSTPAERQRKDSSPLHTG